MIKSMTAFANESKTRDGITVSVEIKCYNSRHLDMAIRLPAAHAGMEEAVRQTASGYMQRGRVEIRINIKNENRDTVSFTINEALADAYHSALHRIRDRYGLADPVLLDHMVKINGIIEPEEIAVDTSEIRPVLEETLALSFATVEKMREAEGKAIAADISKRIEHIETCIVQIEEQARGLLAIYSERLTNRINELTCGMVGIDPGRIAQEAAFIADKSDISEEITRSKSHLAQFRKLMTGEEPAGKPLNFLLQELSREFNTMGAKAGNADIAHIIVSAKTELEKIREQVQNIE
ncbi:MAG: YicC/YloC family endoribonuclease [Desulfosalsimonadaceae bacterium]